MGLLTANAAKLCRQTKALGGDYVWEWPSRCALRDDWRVKALTSTPGAFAIIASSAVDWHDFAGEVKVYIKNNLKIWTTDPNLTAAFSPYQKDEHQEGKNFVECRGRIAYRSAHDPKTNRVNTV